jgi:protein-L-isoaspartate(D-aspartate) O-methyltransferase
MVERIREFGVRDERVLSAMATVPRHAFFDAGFASHAYEDDAWPIGNGQTISQPKVVARSIDLALALMADPARARVLEIGTGCGYAAAVMAQVFGTVFSIERVRELHDKARKNLRPLRLANVRLVFGDGMLGLPSDAPFDAIISAAAGAKVPDCWGAQLAAGGVVVAPVGGIEYQHLTVLSRNAQGAWVSRKADAVRFVPLVGGVSAA